MTEREKLIELLDNAFEKEYCKRGLITAFHTADYLIANGVTVPKKGHWIIRSSGRGSQTTNWAECSECHVCGSPGWKVCPVCETKMDLED